MRSISLNNFNNKFLSISIHDRLSILLTQELVTDIIKRGKPSNIVIKLDMDKAHDRVSWFFLIRVLRKMRVSTTFVNMILRLMSNIYYFELLNC